MLDGVGVVGPLHPEVVQPVGRAQLSGLPRPQVAGKALDSVGAAQIDGGGVIALPFGLTAVRGRVDLELTSVIHRRADVGRFDLRMSRRGSDQGCGGDHGDGADDAGQGVSHSSKVTLTSSVSGTA
ncbi:Uncharacterised protein [Mycobacteroides abscessus subsp. abscessus]|nr:Uncharacterised protein [Mycobacteroides abscessus subsp. abscessus]